MSQEVDHHGQPSMAPVDLADARHHEALVSRFLIFILVCLVVLQICVTQWKKRHPKSYNLVTLAALWLVPAGLSLNAGFWRFLLIWTCFSGLTGYVIHQATRRPLSPSTPRAVYQFFFRAYQLSLYAGTAGYVCFVIELLGIPTLLLGQPGLFGSLAFHLLFYGLYYGILTRDIAEMCGERMTSTILQGKPSGRWGDLCAVCGESLQDEEAESAAGGRGIMHMRRSEHSGGDSSKPKKKKKNIFDSVFGSDGSSGGLSLGLNGFSNEDDDDLSAEDKAAQKTSSIVELECKHRCHDFCLRGWTMIGKKNSCPSCREKVTIKKAFNSPWQTNNSLWISFLDAVRYLIVFNPLILAAMHMGYVFFLQGHAQEHVAVAEQAAALEAAQQAHSVASSIS